MKTQIESILRELRLRPWAIIPEHFEAMVEEFALRVGAGETPRAADRLEAAMSRPARQVAPNVAVIPIVGLLDHRRSFFLDFFGGSSTQHIGRLVDEVAADDELDTVIFDVDSPGGAFDGTPELAAKIVALRGRKRTIAVVNTMMASAAYWVASAAEEIVASPSSLTGSIGVWMMHVDESEFVKSLGVAITLVFAGKYKVERNAWEPLSEDAEARMQEEVNLAYAMFLKDVGKHRGVNVSQVRNGYGEGRVLTASEALTADMVDRVETFDQTVARVTRRRGRRTQTARARLALEGLAKPAGLI